MINVNATKVEKIDCLTYGEIKALNICVLSVGRMGNQQHTFQRHTKLISHVKVE